MSAMLWDAAPHLGSAAALPTREAEKGLRTLVDTVVGKDRAGAEPFERAVSGLGRTAEVGDHREGQRLDAGQLHGDGPTLQSRPDAPLVIADELERIHLSGVRARWGDFHPAETSRRKFEAWILSPVEGPLPELSPDHSLVCAEMLLWAAARTKTITHGELHRLYSPVAEFRQGADFDSTRARRIAEGLLPHGAQRYRSHCPAVEQPQRGDVVMWGDYAEHVAMATGRQARSGSPEVYSFYPPPKDRFTRDPVTGSLGTLTDAVQLVSIDELSGVLTRNGLQWPVRFGRGPW
ncbi:hypothetical protein [Nocardia sp. NPDC004750]